MIRVAIVEDEDKEAALLEEYLQRYGKKYGETFSSVRYTNAVDFLTGYRSEYDIVFMDIELPLMNGMDACFKLREMDQKINIIFVTNMAQYAVKGYEVQAFYYIVKPISYYNLESCLGRAIKQIGLNGDDEIRLSLQKGVVRIRVSRLYYVEVAGHHLIWHTQDGNFENSGTLKAAESKLPAGFSRCNNCYLVNLRHVTGIDGYEVKVGEDTLAVSHARRKPFLHDLNEYLGGLTMFLFDSSLFWYKLVFMGELVAAEALFVYRLKRRRLFALRLLAALLLAFAFAFLLPVVAFNEVWTIFLFLAMWACSVLLLKLCFAESWAKILFCALIAYTAQHIAYDVNNLLGTVTGLTQGVHGLYGEELLGKVNGFSIILYADCYLVIYWLMWLFCGRRIRKGEELSLKHIYLMVLAAVILFIDVVLSIVITYAATEETEQVWLVTCYLYNIISCILAAFLQFGMVNYRHMAQELDIVQGLLYQQKEQYRIAKENIDLINIKCHDLKHQIRSLGEKTVDEGALREIENVVGIYDASVATGNEALDVILTEKSLYCEKNGIRLCCVADGAKLNFMSPADLYALFGNAIENAIESVSRIEDRQKRIINVAVRAAGRLVSIHIDNYFEGEVQIKDGIPVTKKKDTRFHGFGIKSMKYIAEKYDGDFSVSAKEGRFSLNVVIPQRG